MTGIWNRTIIILSALIFLVMLTACGDSTMDRIVQRTFDSLEGQTSQANHVTTVLLDENRTLIETITRQNDLLLGQQAAHEQHLFDLAMSAQVNNLILIIGAFVIVGVVFMLAMRRAARREQADWARYFPPPQDYKVLPPARGNGRALAQRRRQYTYDDED